MPRTTLAGVWLAVAILLPVIASLATPLSTVDLAYQVRAGQEFLATGMIPAVDTFTYSVAGAPWLDQQWLAQLALALAFEAGEWEALAILRAAVIGLTFAIVARAALVQGVAPRTAALLSVGAFAVVVPALALRPQLFGMLIFATLLLVVAERRRRPNVLWIAPVLVAIWANVHGSFILAPALLGYAWLADRNDGRPSRRGFAVLVVASLATFLTPFGPGVWAYAVGLTANPEVTQRVTEWQPTSLRTATGLLFFGSALLVAAWLARRPVATSWPILLWLGVLFLVGAVAVRGAAWWPLGAAVAVAGLLGRPAIERVRPDPPRPANAVVIATLGLAIVALLPVWRPADPLTGRDGLLTHAPSEATTVLRRLAGTDDRLFAPQTLGSWLELTVPQAPVLVDSRIELFPPEVWADHEAVVAGLEGWRDVLDRWAVSIVVVDIRTQAGLAGRLAADPGWRVEHEDRELAIFVRADRP